MNNLSLVSGYRFNIFGIPVMLGLLLFMTPVHSNGQEKSSTITKNSISLEGASMVYIGNYTLSYERILLRTAHYKLNINAGIGGWYFFPVSRTYSGNSIPLTFSSLIGNRNNYFEVDLGMRYTFIKEKVVQSVPEPGANNDELSRFFPVINIGYRYQRPDGNGLIFRSFIGFSGVGIGIGKAF